MSYQGRLQTLVDNILRDFIPQSKKGQNDQIVFPMKNILLLFRAGQFNPILLEQLTRVYHKQVSKNPGNQLYVSRQFLVNHLKDPDLSVYNKQESQTLRNLIMGDRKSIDVADLASKQEHKQMLNSSKLKKAISQEDVMKLIAESQLFKDK